MNHCQAFKMVETAKKVGFPAPEEPIKATTSLFEYPSQMIKTVCPEKDLLKFRNLNH